MNELLITNKMIEVLQMETGLAFMLKNEQEEGKCDASSRPMNAMNSSFQISATPLSSARVTPSLWRNSASSSTWRSAEWARRCLCE